MKPRPKMRTPSLANCRVHFVPIFVHEVDGMLIRVKTCPILGRVFLLHEVMMKTGFWLRDGQGEVAPSQRHYYWNQDGRLPFLIWSGGMADDSMHFFLFVLTTSACYPQFCRTFGIAFFHIADWPFFQLSCRTPWERNLPGDVIMIVNTDRIAGTETRLWPLFLIYS